MDILHTTRAVAEVAITSRHAQALIALDRAPIPEPARANLRHIAAHAVARAN